MLEPFKPFLGHLATAFFTLLTGILFSHFFPPRVKMLLHNFI
jgi:hypothetical protein